MAGASSYQVRRCLALHFQPSQCDLGVLPLDEPVLRGVEKFYAYKETFVAIADDDAALFLHCVCWRIISV